MDILSTAMLLAGLVSSGLITPVYANTNVSDKTLVDKYPKHKVTSAQLKKL
jgi:hypothetical protein